MSDNPGLISGNDTRFMATMRSVRVRTPPADSFDGDVVVLDAAYDDDDHNLDSASSLSQDYVASDPILHHLAHEQAGKPSSDGFVPFVARPAPRTTHIAGVGPRLTKSAALRQGLEWIDPCDERRAAGGDTVVTFDNVPGHKRTGLGLNVSSLAEPSVQPRQNRAALLRSGQPADNAPPVVSTAARAEMAVRNKARDAAERAERRRSVQLPTSITAPESTPRLNRAALLRAGQPVPDASTPRDMAEQAAKNKARDAAERAERRRSVAAPSSLAPPSISPRANRSSMLRTGQGDLVPPTNRKLSHRASTHFAWGAKSGGDAPAVASKAAAEASAAEKALRRASVAGIRSLAAPAIPPRANRSSVLREAPEAPTPRSVSRTSDTNTSVRTESPVKVDSRRPVSMAPNALSTPLPPRPPRAARPVSYVSSTRTTPVIESSERMETILAVPEPTPDLDKESLPSSLPPSRSVSVSPGPPPARPPRRSVTSSPDSEASLPPLLENSSVSPESASSRSRLESPAGTPDLARSPMLESPVLESPVMESPSFDSYSRGSSRSHFFGSSPYRVSQYQPAKPSAPQGHPVPMRSVSADAPTPNAIPVSYVPPRTDESSDGVPVRPSPAELDSFMMPRPRDHMPRRVPEAYLATFYSLPPRPPPMADQVRYTQPRPAPPPPPVPRHSANNSASSTASDKRSSIFRMLKPKASMRLGKSKS